MKRHPELSITLTIIILISVVYSGITIFNAARVSMPPMTIGNANVHTGVVMPIRGAALPQGLHAGAHLAPAE